MTRLFTARVQNGVLVPDVTLPEGTVVTVAVNDDVDVEYVPTPEEQAELDEAIAEVDRGESLSSEEVFARLDRIIAGKRG